MAAKHDAVINELNFKIDKLIKLYISSLEQNKSLKAKYRICNPSLKTCKERTKI